MQRITYRCLYCIPAACKVRFLYFVDVQGVGFWQGRFKVVVFRDDFDVVHTQALAHDEQDGRDEGFQGAAVVIYIVWCQVLELQANVVDAIRVKIANDLLNVVWWNQKHSGNTTI